MGYAGVEEELIKNPKKMQPKQTRIEISQLELAEGKKAEVIALLKSAQPKRKAGKLLAAFEERMSGIPRTPPTAKAPPNFCRMADPFLHHLWKTDQKIIQEITDRNPPPFTKAQYRSVIETNKIILKHVRSEAKSGKTADCVEMLDKYYGGGIISWDQRCAVIAELGSMEELKQQAFLQMKHPTVIPRKRPGKSRQSKKARALREAQEQAREHRKAEEQSRRNDRAATSNRMDQSMKPPIKNRKKSQRKKNRADRTHNYCRKALIKKEKLVNSHRIQQCPALWLKSVTIPTISGRRYVPKKRFQRISDTHVYRSMARMAALCEIFLKKILKSLPKSKRATFFAPVTEIKREREQEAECKFLFFHMSPCACVSCSNTVIVLTQLSVNVEQQLTGLSQAHLFMLVAMLLDHLGLRFPFWKALRFPFWKASVALISARRHQSQSKPLRGGHSAFMCIPTNLLKT